MSAFLVGGMNRRIFRGQQEASGLLAIAAVNVALVGVEEGVAVVPVPRRQVVPRQTGIGVVGRMQVVVEEQQAEQGSGFHHRAARRRRHRRAMLGEGPHQVGVDQAAPLNQISIY